MDENIMLSILYFPLENEDKTKQLLQNQTLKEMEIIEVDADTELEMLYTWTDKISQVKGQYITVVCEGDEFEDTYFERIIRRIRKEKMNVCVSSQVKLLGNRPNFSMFNIDTNKTLKVDLNKTYVCPINFNGTIIKTECFKKIQVRDKGIETQKDFLLRLLMEDMKYLYIPYLEYRYITPRDECFQFFTGTVYEDWYYKSLTDFMIPLLKEIKESKKKIPLFIQYIMMHLIYFRFEANSNNRNKHLIEGKEEVDKYLLLCKELFEYIEDRVILNTDAVSICASSVDVRKLFCQIKYWNFDLDFEYVQNDVSVCQVYENKYIIANSDNIAINIQLIDYIDGKWKIDWSLPNYFPIDKVKYYALVDNKEYPFEYDERYSLTKYFGEAAYKRITGKCYVDIDPAGNKQQLTFIMEYNGTRYPLSMEFKSHTSRLSGKPRFSYWKFDKYIAFIEKKNIIIQMRKARTTIYREFRCLLEMVMTPRKAVYIVLLIRLAYLATRPFYRKKNIWMFYDKLYKGGDSSEYLFKYSKKQKDKIKKYYVLDRKSADYKRMKKEGYHPIIRNSPRHFLTFMNASMMIVSNSTVFAFHNLSLSNSAYLKGFIDFHVCCVQHGLSVQKIAIAQQRLRDNTRLYFCASKYEIENLSKPVYDYVGTGALKLTGVPRYDGLINDDKKQILIAPTWRMQSALLVSRNEGVQRDYNPHFKESDYYKVYNSLINDNRLIEAAKKYGYRIHYVLHPIVSPQAEDFDKNDYVDIIPSVGDMSYEKEFRESSLMVTDFSGVQFDFAYMRKPLVYLHHKDIPQHYEEGTYKYDTMAFGEICHDNDECIDLLIDYMKNNCVMKDEYRKRADDFFCYSDHNNCERIYNEMIEYQNKLGIRTK